MSRRRPIRIPAPRHGQITIFCSKTQRRYWSFLIIRPAQPSSKLPQRMANPTQQIQQLQSSSFNRYLTFIPVLRAVSSRSLIIAQFPDVLSGIQIPASHIPRRYSRYPPRRRAVAAGSARPLMAAWSLWALSCDCPFWMMPEKKRRSNHHAAVLGAFREMRGRTARLPCGSGVGAPPPGGFIAALLWNMARSARVREGIDRHAEGVWVRGSKRVRRGGYRVFG